MNPRIQKPQRGNKYYINTADGGYNGAKGNPLRLNKELTSLPNCIAIYGWFNEVGEQGMKYLKAPWYPYTVIDAAKREGLEITKEPTVGGIMVWTGGKTGEGHVAGVGEVISPTKILSVESEYYGKDWANYWRTKGDGGWRDGCYWMGKSYTYQGCIKNPFVEDDMTKAETEKLIKEMFPALMAEYNKAVADLPVDEWAKPYVEWAKEKGYMDATNRPQSPLKREEAAVIVKACMDDHS